MNIGDKERERHVVPIQVPVPPEKKVDEPAYQTEPEREPVHVDAPTGN